MITSNEILKIDKKIKVLQAKKQELKRRPADVKVGDIVECYFKGEFAESYLVCRDNANKSFFAVFLPDPRSQYNNWGYKITYPSNDKDLQQFLDRLTSADNKLYTYIKKSI